MNFLNLFKFIIFARIELLIYFPNIRIYLQNLNHFIIFNHLTLPPNILLSNGLITDNF